ncbi:Transmembrane and coiled-coil domain-containing protein 5B [Cricetulus griseus]|uniref:Transmembrane and coiled-coil domain-containing protein 5B n=1 Tax=Cricetulus griseus TaxID=10029 RepID=G3HIH6_CRIGR|nr:Transmembrane and coiled-coil domain-containing protein 5B [Cricetulus griseus]ERE72081.1 transmembrane and coiled-coil domain-containing protein 5B-like protein [Cricetulus griseus]
MEDVGPNPMDDGHEITEISSLEAIKENLNYLNADLEKDLQRLDEANQILFRKIQKKEESVQSLEKDIALSIGRVPEKDDFSEIIIQKENALKDLKLETAKLEKKNKTLSKNIMELQKKVKLQKLTESCVQQEEEIAKVRLDRSKAQNDSSQVVKAGATLEETIQNDMEKIIIKKQERKFLLRHFRYLFFMVIIFLRLLGYMVFHLQYINPDLLVDTLPMLMSRSTLKWLRDIVFPFLTLEVEDVLPH